MDTYEISKKTNPMMFGQFRWLGLAREDDKGSKDALKCVSIREKDAVCTDGKRLHKVEHNLGLKPGLYAFEKFTKSKIVMGTAEKSLIFPNIDGIFKDAIERAQEEGSVGIVLPKDHDAAFAILARLALKSDHTVNFYYLENTLSAETTFTVYHGASHQPLYFVSEMYSALIMPKIIKENVANGRKAASSNDNGSEPVSVKA